MKKKGFYISNRISIESMGILDIRKNYVSISPLEGLN